MALMMAECTPSATLPEDFGEPGFGCPDHQTGRCGHRSAGSDAPSEVTNRPHVDIDQDGPAGGSPESGRRRGNAIRLLRLCRANRDASQGPHGLLAKASLTNAA